jgi:hypothetical protein
MLRSMGAGFLLLLGGAHAGAQDFATELPRGLGSLSQLEVVGGAFETQALSATFRFYVRSERSALYEVMRYRLRRGGSDGGGGADPPTEKLVWNEHPGQREPLRCFERIERADPAGAARWREMASGTAEYDAEMRTLIAVLSLHRTAIAPPADPLR